MNASPVRRVIQAITFTLIAVFVVGGFLGLRALVWRQDYQVAAMIQSGLIVSAVVGAALGIAYVLMGSLLWRLLNLDLLSLQAGALLGALLYGGYNAVTPLTPFSVTESASWRALQGGMDGLLIGIVIGALVMLVSGRPLYLDRGGILRYLILFTAVLLIAWAILLLQGFLRLSDILSLMLALPLLVLLKLIVNRLDQRGTIRHYDGYGYDDAG